MAHSHESEIQAKAQWLVLVVSLAGARSSSWLDAAPCAFVPLVFANAGPATATLGSSRQA